ncbi:ABC transporter permease [Plantactinospora sp. GCM10030261]|uniref:ABC transporter permease n=1 Tax=Plantactinospora sp. GCM10030261 TaxID=3273420 RepID=UPI00361E550E
MIELMTSAVIWARTLDAATSLLLVALGGYLCIRSGVFNIGLEGTMIFGCFAAVAGGFWATNWTIGVVSALAAGILVTGILAVAAVWLRADVLLVGLAVNLLGLGGTALLLQWFFDIRGGFTSQRVRPLPRVDLPGVDAVPWLGTVLSGRTVLTYSAWLLTAAVVVWLGFTRSGMALRAVGLRTEIAEASGVSVRRTRSVALLVGGALVGLGGAQLALGDVAQFSENMTSGRGFVALAMVLIAARRAWTLLPLSVGFAVFDVLGLSLQSEGLPSELSYVLPYAAALVVLLVARVWSVRVSRASDESWAGAAEGRRAHA